MPACSILMASSVCTWLPSTRPARAPSSPARGTCTPRVRLKACGHSRSALWRGNARRCQQLRVWRVTPRRLASHQQQPLSPVAAHCPPAESPLRVPDHSRRPRRIACESCANGRDPAGTHHVLPANTTSASPSRTPPPPTAARPRLPPATAHQQKSELIQQREQVLGVPDEHTRHEPRQRGKRAAAGA